MTDFIDDAGGQGGGEGGENTPDPRLEALEAEARGMGWVGAEEFSGNPEDFVDAETFVRRGKEINPILRKNNERLNRELAGARRELDELKLTVKEFGELYHKMSENAYKQAMADVKKQLREARQEGDFELVDSLEDQLDILKEDSKNIQVPGKKEEPTKPDATASQAALIAWMGENPWYNQEKNPRLFHLAEGIAMQVYRQNPHLAGKRELLDMVTAEVKRISPDDFKNPARKVGSPVSGASSSTPGVKAGKHSYADLPAEAKAACDRMVKNMPGFTREKYVSTYFEGE